MIAFDQAVIAEKMPQAAGLLDQFAETERDAAFAHDDGGSVGRGFGVIVQAHALPFRLFIAAEWIRHGPAQDVKAISFTCRKTIDSPGISCFSFVHENETRLRGCRRSSRRSAGPPGPGRSGCPDSTGTGGARHEACGTSRRASEDGERSERTRSDHS